jgi:tetratricopeptide (TPR) repeat protein
MRIVLCIGLLLCVSTPAAGKESAADLERARAHFKTAESFFAAGAYDRAISEYQAAYALVMRPALLFNLGAAYRRRADTTGALDDRRLAVEYYQKYLDAEPRGKGAAEARAHIDALRAEIEAVRPEPASEPPASEPVAEPEPAPALPPPAPSVAPPPIDPAPAPAPAQEDSGRTARTVGLATMGAGAVLIGCGVYFGLRARSASDEVSALQDRWRQDLYDDGRTAQRNLFIVGGAGAAAVAAGALLYLVWGRSGEPAVAVAPASGGAVVQGRF